MVARIAALKRGRLDEQCVFCKAEWLSDRGTFLYVVFDRAMALVYGWYGMSRRLLYQGVELV